MAPPSELSHIRNIGIAAHIDAGKTTLTERILFYTGASHKIGEVHEGAAHMDWMEEEKAHGITITSAVTQCPWKDHLIQVIDTPGHVDFTIEVERAMRVLDGAVIVVDAVRGVEPQTETVWRQASRFSVPRIFFINKMDRPGASYERSMESMVKRLQANPVPVCVPVDGGVIDVVDQVFHTFSGDKGEVMQTGPVPEDHKEVLARHRESMLLAAAEADAELEDAVLEQQEIEPERLWAALRKLTLLGRIHPCFGGSALRNQGVQPLLDGIIRLLPAPLDRPATLATRPGKDPDSEEFHEIVEMEPHGPLAALAFKVQLWEGRRHVFLRIYRGTLHPGDKVLLAGKDNEERIARIFDVDSNVKKRIDEATAGQIVLIAGLRDATTGDTLCDPGHEVLLEPITARDPVLGLAIEPMSGRDEGKFLEVMGKVCEEDPTLRFEEDPDTAQRILKGMGELHLQIVFERIKREFGLDIRAGKPRVMSRETIKGPGRGEADLDRTIALPDGREVVMRARAVAQVAPTERGSGIQVTVGTPHPARRHRAHTRPTRGHPIRRKRQHGGRSHRGSAAAGCRGPYRRGPDSTRWAARHKPCASRWPRRSGRRWRTPAAAFCSPRCGSRSRSPTRTWARCWVTCRPARPASPARRARWVPPPSRESVPWSVCSATPPTYAA